MLLQWQAADQWWEDAAWGLVGRLEDAYPRRPLFAAFQALLPVLPRETRILKVEQSGLGPYAAAFRRPDGRIVVAAVNGSSSPVHARIAMEGTSPLTLLQTRRFSAGGLATEERVEPLPATFDVHIPGPGAVVYVAEPSAAEQQPVTP